MVRSARRPTPGDCHSIKVRKSHRPPENIGSMDRELGNYICFLPGMKNVGASCKSTRHPTIMDRIDFWSLQVECSEPSTLWYRNENHGKPLIHINSNPFNL